MHLIRIFSCIGQLATARIAAHRIASTNGDRTMNAPNRIAEVNRMLTSSLAGEVLLLLMMRVRTGDGSGS